MDPEQNPQHGRPASLHRENQTTHHGVRRDVQWGTRIFRAPALPTPNQLSNELPFTVNLRPRLRRAT